MIEDEDDDCDNEDGWSGDNEKGKRSEKPKKKTSLTTASKI